MKKRSAGPNKVYYTPILCDRCSASAQGEDTSASKDPKAKGENPPKRRNVGSSFRVSPERDLPPVCALLYAILMTHQATIESTNRRSSFQNAPSAERRRS